MNFEAIFGTISKVDLIFDLVGVYSSKGDKKSNSMKQILRVTCVWLPSILPLN